MQHEFQEVKAELSVRFVHRICFTRDVLSAENPALARTLNDDTFDDMPSPVRTLVVVDDGVMTHWPDLAQRIQRYFDAHDRELALANCVHAVPGGESSKNDVTRLESVCRIIHGSGLCRHSYVVAIGGGAVLDLVGFACAISHRGIRLVRIPTTTLAQADAGMGVKNGVNAFGQKNQLGTFAPPWAVINDTRFLATLSDRDWRCGFAEAVKVALIKAPDLFDQIVAALPHLANRHMEAAGPILHRSALLHMRHITEGGDPFERTTARPLDFGHWAAHKLEQMSGFRLRHGEAVAIGMALDVMYSSITGLLPDEQASAVIDCLERLGFVLDDPVLVQGDRLLGGLDEFRQHLGGRLTVTLLTGIGRPVDVHDIDPSGMLEAIRYLATLRSASAHALSTAPAPGSIA